MTTKVSELAPIQCKAGVQPSTDKTALLTEHWTFSDKIRFVDGVPEKIGGWASVLFSNNGTIKGANRTVYSITINGRVITILGTEKKLYALIGSSLINITPLKTSTVAVANSLSTNYGTLASNPLTTVSGSSTITVTDTSASRYVAGDRVTLSGASSVGGISNTLINTQHIIRSIGTNSYTIHVGGTASSSATGGGASVVRRTGLIQVTSAAHGQSNGDRVKITNAADTGGILAADINKEFIIRNVAANSFDIKTDSFATSSVTGGGGASTIYQEEIDEGRLNASLGQGFGMGLYGAGLYGTSNLSTSGLQYPRIWFADGYGENVILTAGNQGAVYVWDGDTAAAPIVLSGAPAAVNYAFVSDNIVVTFGASNIGNHIFTSDQDDNTNWTASSTNQVFEDFIENTGRLLSHVEVADTNLIFTEDHTYTFRYIGLPLVWEIKNKSSVIGIISPMARCAVNEVAYWMGNENFYMWNGGNIEIIPSNSDKQSTILNYVFENLNYTQKSKCFAWYNKAFHEVWFHYPSANSLECDRIARVNLHDYSWCPDTMDRAGAEYPDILLNLPRLSMYNKTTAESVLYRHETGANDNGAALEFSLSTNLRTTGKSTTTEVGIIPDSIQTGTVNLAFDGYLFPQSQTTTYSKTYPIESTTERVTTLVNGRFWMYNFSGAEVNQTWRMGLWQEYIQRGASN